MHIVPQCALPDTQAFEDVYQQAFTQAQQRWLTDHEEIKAFADAIINGSEWPIPLWQMVQSTIVSFSGSK